MSVINGILYRKMMLLGVNVVCWWFCASSKAPFFICWVTKAQPVILTILTLILVLAIVFCFGLKCIEQPLDMCGSLRSTSVGTYLRYRHRAFFNVFLPHPPIEVVGIDLFRRIIFYATENKFRTVTIDHATRYVERMVVQVAIVVAVVPFVLYNPILRHVASRILISDRGCSSPVNPDNPLLRASNVLR